MSWCRGLSATRQTTEGFYYDGYFVIRVNNSDETPTRIFYKKPTNNRITRFGNSFYLQISDFEGNDRTIKCFVGNLQNATEGNYYGPFPILVSGSRFPLKLYFPEDMCKKLKKWNAETHLYYKNESEICSWIYKYVVDDPACESCDLSLAPTKIENDFEPSSTSDSESQGPSLIHYNSKIHGVINIKKDSPFSASREEIKLLYVIPLEEDIQKCLESRKDLPLQFLRSDLSFQIFPCEPKKIRNGRFRTKYCMFDIKVKAKKRRYTSLECYIPNFPALLEGLLSCDSSVLVENLKNGRPGNYYGPYEISVKNKWENGSTFKCYFREDMNEKMQDFKNFQSLYFINNIGKRSWIYKYVLDLPACKWCDLSYVPTIVPKRIASSYASCSETQGFPQIDPDPIPFGTITFKVSNHSTAGDIGEVELKYVMPLAKDIRKCIDSGKAYPLQFWRTGGSFCIRPCFDKNVRLLGSENNLSLGNIVVLNDNGFAEEMECRITNLLPLVEREMGSSRECCTYTIIYNDENNKEERKSFTYTKPTYADFTNGPNPHCLETFNNGKIDKYRVYCGDIDTFDPNFYFGPFLIQSVYNDGTRGPWLDCYFKKDLNYQDIEDKIHHLEQELEFEDLDFKFKENPFDGIDQQRNDTTVLSSQNGISRRVIRTITLQYFNGNGSSGSEI